MNLNASILVLTHGLGAEPEGRAFSKLEHP